jgi:hypothetical protein
MLKVFFGKNNVQSFSKVIHLAPSYRFWPKWWFIFTLSIGLLKSSQAYQNLLYIFFFIQNNQEKKFKPPNPLISLIITYFLHI